MPLLAFVVTAMVTSGPLVLNLMALNATDPLFGVHAASEFSLDVPAPVIPNVW